MKAATVKQLKDELNNLSQQQLIDTCLRLSKFKKENKELLTYLLFEAEDEYGYRNYIKETVDDLFLTVNTNSFFYIKKSVRKILKEVKKYIRYSPNKETEVELLLYFCNKLKEMKPSYKNNIMMVNLYNREKQLISRKISTLHEDLQYDYTLELEKL